MQNLCHFLHPFASKIAFFFELEKIEKWKKIKSMHDDVARCKLASIFQFSYLKMQKKMQISFFLVV